MKEKYIKPDSDIQKFAAVDVITTSGGGDEPIVTPPDWNLSLIHISEPTRH